MIKIYSALRNKKYTSNVRIYIIVNLCIIGWNKCTK